MIRRISLIVLILLLPCAGQEVGGASVVSAGGRAGTSGSFLTRPDARAITLKIPAPRGLILDRHGEVFAQNRIVYRLSLQYQQFDQMDREYVIRWGRVRLQALQKIYPKVLVKSDEELFQHYRHRRWLPMYVSGELDEQSAALLRPQLPSGTVLTPVYSRYYPHGSLAAHVIGYSGSEGKLETGPILSNEPFWEEMEGRAGLEKLFDQRLVGKPGKKRLIFDEHGNLLLEELSERPVPGGTLVTTLDLKWQLLAEKVLEEGCERGAFVVVDVISGEVLVLASRPSFDLNLFIPRISDATFKQLNEDPATPLYGRAFQSAYPPASTFKSIVALAALNEGVVTAESLIDCPAAIRVGNVVFNNWSPTPEGEINVMRAIQRSCNTWFYQVGIQMGAKPFIGLAGRLGFGQKSGLPLIGETPGILPDDAWMRKHEGRPILDGDTANMSIGQGSMLASPLQVAQAMAGIGNGKVTPKLQLIYQQQDSRGRVTQATSPQPRQDLAVNDYAVLITRMGMSDVVNAGGGTGLGARLSYAKLCGKTGTAQWGPESKNQRLAWFAGFVPEENPRYAFAVLYEGKPNERVSGGRLAAPMVKKFFEGIKDDILEKISPPKKALVVIGEEEGAVPTAVPVDESQLLVPTTEGFLRRTDDRPLRATPVEPMPNGSVGEVQQPADGEVPLRAIPLFEPGQLPLEPGDEEPQRAIPVHEPADSPEAPARAIPVYE